MKGKPFLLSFLMLSQGVQLFSQSYDFEKSTEPARAQVSGTVTRSQQRWKDGSASLLWEWTRTGSQLLFDEAVPFDMSNFRQGPIFWVYNETPVNDVLKCRFVDSSNTTQYEFDFRLNFSGWRIARMGSVGMTGPKKVRTGLKMIFDSPASLPQGRLFIDRMSFSADVDYRTANDAQLPVPMNADWLTHWSKLYDWSQLPAPALPASLTTDQLRQLQSVRTALDATLTKNNNQINSAAVFFAASGIREENGVITGRPFVAYNDKGRATGSDMTYDDFGPMLSGLAQDYLFNGSAQARKNFLLAVRFGFDQGFAEGSSMGNNTHYGYYSRAIFPALYAMRGVLKEEGLLDQATRAAAYWSGLGETRKSFNYTRGGIVDCWNTLLAARLYAAAMPDDDISAFVGLKNLVSWTDRSFYPTSGTAGGMKGDGTVFHHAGHYPAYAIGGLSGAGFFFRIINESGFSVSDIARESLRRALIAMTQYSNLTDWTIGFAGRHPHSGGINSGTIDAMAYVALHGGIDDPAQNVDTLLGNAFLRLQTGDNDLAARLRAEGCTASRNPQGFFVFNHHAAGVYRTGNAMVTVKGYNEQVWGSEIYTADNRYGRYQGYGALEVMNGGTPVSRLKSGFSEPGWDWNCLPGTTTIMLPNDLLNSPQLGTLMAKSTEKFAGASSLNDAGIFGMKLAEASGTNFTPTHKARKSVFFFGDRVICLGTDIVNNNSAYPTTTTLFQQSISQPMLQTVDLNGQIQPAMGTDLTDTGTGYRWISDLSGNYYRVPAGMKLVVTGKNQTSNHNQTKAQTKGDFLLARLDHGTAPSSRGYEYMLALTPDAARLAQMKQSGCDYTVVQRDRVAHIVRDEKTLTTGYVVFDTWSSSKDTYLRSLNSESLVMIRPNTNGTLALSVCAPDLNFGETKSGSDETFKQSRDLEKTVVLNGEWELPDEDAYEGAVQVNATSSQTTVTVYCSQGQPVSMTLYDKNYTSTEQIPVAGKPVVTTDGQQISIQGESREVWVMLADGRVLFHEAGSVENRVFERPQVKGPLLIIVSYGDVQQLKMMI